MGPAPRGGGVVRGSCGGGRAVPPPGPVAPSAPGPGGQDRPRHAAVMSRPQPGDRAPHGAPSFPSPVAGSSLISGFAKK